MEKENMTLQSDVNKKNHTGRGSRLPAALQDKEAAVAKYKK